jgi:hypothetical protein
MIMINEFFILGIIFIPFFILKIQDLQKIVTAIVYVNILFMIANYYANPFVKDKLFGDFANSIFNITRSFISI